MSHLNSYTQIKAPSPLIQIRSNDNALELKGETSEGYVNKSILLDDPELASKATGLVEDMKQHQRQKLVEFCGGEAPALVEFDEQITQLQGQLNTFLEAV